MIQKHNEESLEQLLQEHEEVVVRFSVPVVPTQKEMVMRHRFLMAVPADHAASNTLMRMRDMATKHGWKRNCSLIEWLDKQLTEGNQARQLVQRWEEDSRKGME